MSPHPHYHQICLAGNAVEKQPQHSLSPHPLPHPLPSSLLCLRPCSPTHAAQTDTTQRTACVRLVRAGAMRHQWGEGSTIVQFHPQLDVSTGTERRGQSTRYINKLQFIDHRNTYHLFLPICHTLFNPFSSLSASLTLSYLTCWSNIRMAHDVARRDGGMTLKDVLA